MSDEPRRKPIIRRLEVEVAESDDFDTVEARIFESLIDKGVPSEHAGNIAAGMARDIMQKKEAKEKRDAMFAHLRELSEALDDSWKRNQRMIRRAAWSVGVLWVVIVLGFVIDLARGFEVYLHH